jgi:hypothetical protein
MVAVGESGSESGSEDPYTRLGLSQDATFEQVKRLKPVVSLMLTVTIRPVPVLKLPTTLF